MYTGEYLFAINPVGAAHLSPDEHIRLLAEVGWNGFFTGWNAKKTPLWRAADVFILAADHLADGLGRQLPVHTSGNRF